MATPTLAKEFFDQILGASDKAAFLAALADPRQPRFEEEWLEFKEAPDIAGSDVQQNWSKALSGFANTGGGVLIWGIKAKRDAETGVDVACAIAPVENPAALKSRLMQLHHQATDPPITGVVVEHIDVEPGKGFVVCLIPTSPFRPHRAEHVKNRPYYIRAGDDFVLAPVAVLRAMFYPKSKPHLRIRASFLSLVEQGQGIRWTFRVYNDGTATARDVGVSIRTRGELHDYFPGQTCSKGGIDDERGFILYCALPLHPGAWHDVLIVDERVQGRSVRSHATRFEICMYASDHEPQAAEISFTDHDFINRDPKYGVPIEVAEVPT